MTLTALDDGGPLPNGSGPPTVSRDARGAYVVTWPQGRAATVELSADLFESMVADLNGGRLAMRALDAISQALTDVVPAVVPSA
jgi:hypothetical protein